MHVEIKRYGSTGVKITDMVMVAPRGMHPDECRRILNKVEDDNANVDTTQVAIETLEGYGFEMFVTSSITVGWNL